MRARGSAGVFFLLTDLLDYCERAIDVRSEDRLPQSLRRLTFPDGLDGLSDDQIEKAAVQEEMAN